ncbi:MAG: RagB/SusD family nutrient uptake outer membrane protein [Chitinophagaceae bacterium]|nr:RagB/SusD family nutrient uptake outer membrane protein [Chitinophagaceae bacterium]
MKLYTKIISVLIWSLILFTGCRKFITVEAPDNLITEQNIYNDDITATSVITGLYSKCDGLSVGVATITGLSADEYILWPNVSDIHRPAYYTNNLRATVNVNTGKDIWNDFYSLIFICNAAIEGITASKSLTVSVQQQLLGETYFMRAFFYHFLAELYGDLPLATGTDPEVNRLLTRKPLNEVYDFIISDLSKAREMLSEQYLNGLLKPYANGPERIRPTKWAANALLARVYLYSGDFAKAESIATEVISNSSLFSLSPLNDVFLKNNSEAIWQLQPTGIGINTRDGVLFNLKSIPEGLSDDKPLHISSFLLNSFEVNDQRAVAGNWLDNIVVDSDTLWYTNKYKEGTPNSNIISTADMTEYTMVLRLGEQYLIRAEARARLGDINGAQADIDEIRTRAGLPGTAAVDQETMLAAVFNERKVELFSEWAHRWVDLKRSGTVDAVMSTVAPIKGGAWESADQLYPIPYEDIQRNPNLTQNPAY